MDSKLNLPDIRAGRIKDLTGADLRGADLRGAFLTGANLAGANLAGANLTRANLFDANLHGADLHGANLIDADLRCAHLTRVKINGPELMYVKWFDCCTLPARLLPWLTTHPRFAAWLPTLKIVED